jgi:hypothetical protein
MGSYRLRPPLPEPLTHEGIPFVLDVSNRGGEPSAETLAAIAASLTVMLPEGDLYVDAQGQLHSRTAAGAIRTSVSLWYQSGLLSGIERSSL